MALPLTQAQVTKGSAWLLMNFGGDIASAVAGKQYSAAIVCAIACKETGFIWIGRTRTHKPQDLLPLLIGDASGDIEGHPRRAFPRNSDAFEDEYGTEFTEMLIGEANKARDLRGLRPAHIVYKGYGLFQYDLQHVKNDQAFFKDKLWYDIGPCLQRLTRELDRCFDNPESRWDAVRKYNGQGPRAEIYADHVMQFAEWVAGSELV